MEIELTIKQLPTPPVPVVPPPSYTATYRCVGLVMEITSAAPYGFRNVSLQVMASPDARVSPAVNLIMWAPIPYAIFEEDLALFLASFVDAVEAREHERRQAVGGGAPEADRG